MKYSPKKSATVREIGNEIIRAINDVNIVPIIKGNAPKTPETGSHSEPDINL